MFLLISNLAKSILTKIIKPYSIIKIIENKPPMNSVLKPLTSSDSPSKKSNGLRPISLKIKIIQIIEKNKFNKKLKEFI